MYDEIILSNEQFGTLCNEEISCNSFLFESSDEILLSNFSYCFAKFLLCSGEKKPCNKCLNCEKVNLHSHSDIKEYPQNHKNILVEDIKDLIDKIYLSSIESDKKIFILNNFSSSTIQAQNKLLKILEEPPLNAYIILNVNNINKVLPTVLSRCKKIRLNALSDETIEKIVESNDEYQKTAIVALSSGNLTKAITYKQDKNFWNLYNSCLNTLIEMKDSKSLIKYSSNLSLQKENMETILEIFESFFRDLLLIRLKQNYLVKNKNILDKLLTISNEYNCDSIDLIIKKIYEIKKKLDFNCNATFLLDNFLLYVLEVKFLCNKG